MIYEPDYLGDGVYVCFDGYQIELRGNDFDAPTDVIYLEPSVVQALRRYFDRIDALRGVEQRA
mgnify:CR=1 FL=1